ncbi:MAG: hypothetical protein H8E17_20055 [Deltaproteobacteria bacterium]|nr:hypothetical protein [Deltaproteobacteria bacterium]
MGATDINKVIEVFNLLPMDEKEYVADVLNKQLIEFRREKIANRADEARKNLKEGDVKSGTFQDLYEDLEND